MKILLPVLLFASSAFAGVDNFALLDHRGRFHELRYYGDASAIVLFVQGNGCPIARGAIPALTELRREFEPRGVVFLGLNANTQDDRESVAREARDYDIGIPVLIDEGQLVAESLGVTRTAEAIVVAPGDWRIVYRGPIDDRLDYETQKPVKARWLRDALQSHLSGETPSVTKQPSPGCLVFFPDADRERHEEISYAEDVAPILQRRCTSCHVEGGVAPFPMTDYGMVRGWSAMIRETIRTRRMPPWHADRRGLRFSNDASLTVQEEKTLVHWIEAGALRGDGPDPLAEATPTKRVDWPLGEPDLVMTVERQVIPASGVVPYRYITQAVPLDEDVWMVGADVLPSNFQVMHHGTAFVRYPEGHERAEPAESRFTEGLFAGYVPGREPWRYPEGGAVFLPKGSKIEFQLHYTATGREETDTPRLALYLSREPLEHELRISGVPNWRFEIPPGAKEYEEEARRTLDRDVVLYRLAPHMHYRGKRMSYEARYPDGSTELLLSVPNFKFNWQRNYVLEQPKLLPRGTELVVRAAFDNSDRNPANPDPTATVRFGEQSWDEMLIGYYTYRTLKEGETFSAGSAPDWAQSPH